MQVTIHEDEGLVTAAASNPDGRDHHWAHMVGPTVTTHPRVAAKLRERLRTRPPANQVELTEAIAQCMGEADEELEKDTKLAESAAGEWERREP